MSKRAYFCLTGRFSFDIIVKLYGGVAQLARAFGSYPTGRRFKSHRRYQARWSSGLRHRPFTAVTRVRISYGSPRRSAVAAVKYPVFGLGIFHMLFCKMRPYSGYAPLWRLLSAFAVPDQKTKPAKQGRHGHAVFMRARRMQKAPVLFCRGVRTLCLF